MANSWDQSRSEIIIVNPILNKLKDQTIYNVRKLRILYFVVLPNKWTFLYAIKYLPLIPLKNLNTLSTKIIYDWITWPEILKSVTYFIWV
jgi:hypothetical protein